MAPKRIKEELIIFEQLSQIAPPTWVDFFKTCSQGKFPPKVKILDGIIVFRRSTAKVFTCQVPTEANQSELERCCRFFRDDVGITIDVPGVNPCVTQPKQSLLKSLSYHNNLRNSCFFYYAKYVAERDNLTDTEKEQLFAVIALGCLAGLIPKSAITISTHEEGYEYISHIDGIDRDVNGNFYFKAVHHLNPTLSKTRPTLAKNTIQDLWQAYIGKSKKRTTAISNDTSDW